MAGDAAVLLPVLPEGCRAQAVTVPSDQVVAVRPGDRLDVLVTFDAEMKDERTEKVTATILQNIVVLDRTASATGLSRSVLVLILNPNEAQYLAPAQDGGHTIRVVRRAQGDTKMAAMEMASFRKLFR